MNCIYGIFDGEDCIYIGLTTNLKERKKEHATYRFHGKEVRVLRELASEDDGKLIETETIRDFVKRGHKLRNINQRLRSDTTAVRIPTWLHTEIKWDTARNGQKLGEAVIEQLLKKWPNAKARRQAK